MLLRLHSDRIVPALIMGCEGIVQSLELLLVLEFQLQLVILNDKQSFNKLFHAPSLRVLFLLHSNTGRSL
jgi:hypothetical protein